MRQRGINVNKVLADAANSGLIAALDIGLHPEDLEARVRLLSHFPQILFSSGIAPSEVESPNWRILLPSLEEQCKSTSIVAVGECGLDWHWDYGTKSDQIELFEKQTDVAARYNLPLIVHNRDADQQVYDVLFDRSGENPIILHCYSSDYSWAKKFLNLNVYVSFAGNITYKNSGFLQEVAANIPLKTILVETDSPFLAPQPVRGKPNTPLNIRHTYECIAQIRGISLGVLMESVKQSFFSAFKGPQKLFE